MGVDSRHMILPGKRQILLRGAHQTRASAYLLSAALNLKSHRTDAMLPDGSSPPSGIVSQRSNTENQESTTLRVNSKQGCFFVWGWE